MIYPKYANMSIYLRSNHGIVVKKVIKIFFWAYIINDEKPTITRSKYIIRRIKKVVELLAQESGIKGYESMSRDKLLSALKSSENKSRIEKIREEIKKLSNKFSRQEIKEIKKKLYEIENKKGLSASKKTKKYLDKLEDRIYKLKTYYDYDDAEYKGITDIKGLFDLSSGEDYYKPINVNTAFNNKYIKYESKEIKIKY